MHCRTFTVNAAARLARGKAPLHPRQLRRSNQVSMQPQTGRSRRFRISIRVSAQERLALQQRAIHAGLAFSAYARLILLEAKPPRAARRPPVEVSLLVQTLDRLGVIASNLLQVTAAVRADAFSLMPSCERDLWRTLADLRSLRPVLLKALGKRQGPA
jgi:mobilization protein NikA